MGKRINIFSLKLVKESAKIYNVDLDDKQITSPSSAVRIVNEVLDLENMPNEHFVILTLGTRNNILGVHTVHIGTLNEAIVHPRDIFQHALLTNANSIMCFHNHPSGDPSPSEADIVVTRRIVDAGRLLGIRVLDHVVIGRGQYHSLREKNGVRSGLREF